MPQARSGSSGSTSSSGAKSSSKRTTTKRSSSSSGTRAKSTRASSASSRKTSGRSRSATKKTSAATSSVTSDPRLDAIAQRVRKLNERIIEAGKEAGETTLTSYERALKAIATGIEKGPGASDVDWISNLATAQAKFIRDVTTAWTVAARNVLK